MPVEPVKPVVDVKAPEPAKPTGAASGGGASEAEKPVLVDATKPVDAPKPVVDVKPIEAVKEPVKPADVVEH